MIRALLQLAESKGLDGVVVPVRPSVKAMHPQPYDPWLRSHYSVGGKLIGPCERSMVVHEPVAFWENWAKKRFERSGAYALEGALAPVRIDLDSQSGTYEPNVWVSYGS